VIILDRMLVGGIKFVLGKVAAAVEAELNDDSHLREELLAAQMRFELGEIGDEELRALEADLLARLRVIRERQMGEAPRPGEMKVTGVEATIHGEE
jgi:hypothetical protein